MTEVAASGAAEDVTNAANPPDVNSSPDNDAEMAAVKTEDASEDIAGASNHALTDVQGEDGDSEAETLIQSPEKKKNIVDGAPDLRPTLSGGARRTNENGTAAPESSKNTKKRKRDATADGNAEPSRGSSSSPLSSPNMQAQSRDSDSDISDTPRAVRSARMRRPGPKADSDGVDGSAQAKSKKRRPSDIIPPTKHRTRGSVGHIDTSTEHRETRSATYPRHSSEDRSPSPRPSSSRRDHKRGASTQITAGDVERKKRGRPPNINTRRNKSVERGDSSDDDDDDSSPAPRKINLDRFDSRNDPSPAKPSGPRKYRDKNGRTFLSRACNNEDLEKAKICLEERPEDINLPDNAGNTPLQIASLEGFTDIVRFLLESGAEVDTRNIDKDTPLIDAIENSHFEVVELLLRHGANPRLANSKGDEPYDLVPVDDENYIQTRKLIAEAKEVDWTKRRKSSDNDGNGGSSRAASAASPRDSPPVIGPRSPPGLSSRRRTGRSESTRNDLLWQQNTQENLQRLAAKGNVQGVATILNVLQKAEPASVIAAAKAGHEEVLQLMLAIGDADADPDPQLDLKSGYNTPILAAIGRGNIDVVKLLVEQTGFNAARKHKGRTYFEISAERKGESWQKEYDILKDAYDKHPSGKPKTKSPRKVRDADRPREKRLRRSESPPSSNLRTSSSPTTTHKSLPDKSPRSSRKEGKKTSPMVEKPDARRGELQREDPNVAVASDQEQTVHDKRGHKHRRSQSDMPQPANLEAEITQRRRRLVTGKEHRRSQSGAGTGLSDDSTSEIEVKREKSAPGLKRTRSSASPDARGSESGRVVVKKRRTVLESSPEEGRPAPRSKSSEGAPVIPDIEMQDQDGEAGPSGSSRAERSTPPEQASIIEHHPHTDQSGSINGDAAHVQSPSVEEQDAPGEPDELAVEEAPTPQQAVDDAASQDLTRQKSEADQKAAEEKIEEQTAAEARAAEAERLAEEKIAHERALAEKAASERAEAERLAAEKEAAERVEAEKRAAEEAEAKRKLDEAEAKRKAEEDAAARKKEQEEREEQKRRDLQRRQEEQIRLQHLEIERRRREALPSALATAALLIENNDPRAKAHEWLAHFLPLFTVTTEQLAPSASFAAPEDKWIPNFQAATFLATKDLNLRNYTLIERRPVNEAEKLRMWKVARHILSYDYQTNSFNTTIKRAIQVEKEQYPKFINMTEVFWVKYSDFMDQAVRQEHLKGFTLNEQRITIHVPIFNGQRLVAQLPGRVNGIQADTQVNGDGSHQQQSPTSAPYTNGGSR